MDDKHHLATYADRSRYETVTIEENVPVAQDTYRVRFGCPEIARRVVPGQFLMLRLPDRDDPLLGRPLAVYDVVRDSDGTPRALDIVYLVIGKMTSRLAALADGSRLEVWGPLGNGFPPTPVEHLLMVAGGIGQTPFLMLAKEYLGLEAYGETARDVPKAERVSLCYGARNEAYLAGVEDFERIGVDLRISTDDGSAGHHGLVTELIGPTVEESAVPECRIVCCGPEPMIESTARIARAMKIPCQVSLETPMACGIGICFSCVTKIRDESGQWDYRRTCVEGPVFDAERVEF